MLPDIDPVLLSVGFVAVAAIALFFGAVLDAIMQENGFGPTGNACCSRPASSAPSMSPTATASDSRT